MPLCNLVHEVKLENGKTITLPHEYRAGVCLLAHSEGTQEFLKACYPYYHGLDYEYSKHLHPTDMEYGV